MNKISIKYIYHSSFIIEDDEYFLLFDYPPLKILKKRKDFKNVPDEIEILELAKNKNIFVFISHFHIDHFNPEVFEWRKKIDVNYVISHDVFEKKKKFLNFTKNLHILSAKDFNYIYSKLKGIEYKIPDFDVEVKFKDLVINALPSTDFGCSFYINFKGVKIFFPGDFALWKFEKLGEYRKGIKELFCETFEILKKKGVDILFSVLPSSKDELKETGWAGADELLKNLKPILFVPVHLKGNYEIIEEFERSGKIDIPIFKYSQSFEKYIFGRKKSRVIPKT